MSESMRMAHGPFTSFQTPFGTVHTLSLRSFFDMLLPSSSRADARLDGILRSFRRKAGSVGRLVAKNGRLWGYSRKTPSELDPSRAFLHIRRCVRKLSAVATSQAPCLSFDHVEEDMKGTGDNIQSYPDAFFRLRSPQNDATKTSSWNDIAVPAAYTQRTDLDDIQEVRSVVPQSTTMPRSLTTCNRITIESFDIWRIA